jgi:transcriptional regulator with XRE-family HTH domain
MAGRTAFPEIVAALKRLDLSDRAVEREAGVPQGFISKLRRGECGSAKAAPSLAKLLALLEAKGVSVEVALPAAGLPAPPVHAAPVPQELAALVDEADTHEAIGRALKVAARLVVLGQLDRFTAQAVESILKARGAALEREEAERARINADKPVTVSVEFLNDPRGAPACARCYGTGREPQA